MNATRRIPLLWLVAAPFCPGVLSAARASDTVDLPELHARCVPTAAFSTLQAIVYAESGGHPNAIQLDYPQRILEQWRLPHGTLQFRRQPRNRAEALQWTAALADKGITVDLGLMQISTVEAKRRNLPVAALLDPCTNLQVGWGVFGEDYRISARTYGDSQGALWHALSRYNTGSDEAGIRNGYLRHVMRSLLESEHSVAAPAMSAAERSLTTGPNYKRSDRGSSP